MKVSRECKIQSVVSTPSLFETARRLVSEYVDATAQEMESDPAEFLPFIDGYSNFPGVFSDKGEFLIAFVDGQAAGCLGLKRLSDSACEMKSLWLRPEHRSKGIAQRLILASFKAAQSLGYEWMRLDVLPSRKGPIRLYEKLGFEEGPLSHDYTFEMVGYQRRLRM